MVILEIKDSNDEANRQLNDTNNYEQLDFNTTVLHTGKFKSEINNLKNENLLTLKTANSLLEEKIKHLSFTFFQKCIKLTFQEDPLLVLLTATLAEFQNLFIIITYNLR